MKSAKICALIAVAMTISFHGYAATIESDVKIHESASPVHVASMAGVCAGTPKGNVLSAADEYQNKPDAACEKLLVAADRSFFNALPLSLSTLLGIQTAG